MNCERLRLPFPQTANHGSFLSMICRRLPSEASRDIISQFEFKQIYFVDCRQLRRSQMENVWTCDYSVSLNTRPCSTRTEEKQTTKQPTLNKSKPTKKNQHPPSKTHYYDTLNNIPDHNEVYLPSPLHNHIYYHNRYSDCSLHMGGTQTHHPSHRLANISSDSPRHPLLDFSLINASECQENSLNLRLKIIQQFASSLFHYEKHSCEHLNERNSISQMQNRLSDILKAADVVLSKPSTSIQNACKEYGVAISPTTGMVVGAIIMQSPLLSLTLWISNKVLKSKRDRQEKERMKNEIIRKQQAIINKLHRENELNKQEIKNLRETLDMLEGVVSQLDAA